MCRVGRSDPEESIASRVRQEETKLKLLLAEVQDLIAMRKEMSRLSDSYGDADIRNGLIVQDCIVVVVYKKGNSS